MGKAAVGSANINNFINPLLCNIFLLIPLIHSPSIMAIARGILYNAQRYPILGCISQAKIKTRTHTGVRITEHPMRAGRLDNLMIFIGELC